MYVCYAYMYSVYSVLKLRGPPGAQHAALHSGNHWLRECHSETKESPTAAMMASSIHQRDSQVQSYVCPDTAGFLGLTKDWRLHMAGGCAQRYVSAAGTCLLPDQLTVKSRQAIQDVHCFWGAILCVLLSSLTRAIAATGIVVFSKTMIPNV